MNIDATYKRAVRIIGKPGVPHGSAIIVYDVLTEEQITNVESAIIRIGAAAISTIELTYYEVNGQGLTIANPNDDGALRKTIMIESEKHEVDVTAFEV